MENIESTVSHAGTHLFEGKVPFTHIKRCLVAAALLLGTGAGTMAYAQSDVNLTTVKATALERKYLRPSLTKIYITDGNSSSLAAVDSLKSIKDEKFDYNTLERDVYRMPSIPADDKARKDSIDSFINNLLGEQKISNQIMHCWFPTDSNGDLSIEKLVERGQYAATDADVRKSEVSKRNTLLNELGEQLIDRSYIVVFLVETSVTEKNTSTHVKPYVYKLDFSDEVKATFYDNNYTASGIDQMEFPTKFVTSAKNGVRFDANETEDSYEEIMYKLRKVADFQVKSPVTFTHPIRANIGKKEGVKCDARYAVMRLTEDKEGKTKAQRVATVRATGKILDNRGIADGQVDEEQQTKFYEVKGRKVTPGQTLVEDKDKGFNVAVEYTISEASVSFGYRLGKHLNVPGLFVYLKAGMPFGKGLGGIKIMAANKKGEWKSFQVFEGSIGVAKEFNFAGTFALTAGIEGGYLIAPGAKNTWYENNAWRYDESKDFDSKSYKVGAHVKLGYYVTRNIQIYANVGYNYYIKSDKLVTLQEYWVESEKSNRHKFQKFQPLALGFGVNFGF